VARVSSACCCGLTANTCCACRELSCSVRRCVPHCRTAASASVPPSRISSSWRPFVVVHLEALHHSHLPSRTLACRVPLFGVPFSLRMPRAFPSRALVGPARVVAIVAAKTSVCRVPSADAPVRGSFPTEKCPAPHRNPSATRNVVDATPSGSFVRSACNRLTNV